MDFLNTAFNEIELEMVNSNMNRDPVFLLYVGEVNQYFTSNAARKCVATDYAVAQGATNRVKDFRDTSEPTCSWWLGETPKGFNSDSAVYVRFDGQVMDDGIYNNHVHNGVRPAMWISLDY